MRTYLRTEYILVAIMWLFALFTYIPALFTWYSFSLTDGLGITALCVVTVISIVKPQKATAALSLLLLPGIFNLFCFTASFNIVFYFGFGGLLRPGIQVYALLLFVMLFVRRAPVFRAWFRALFFGTEKEQQEQENRAMLAFKRKFSKLPDAAIEAKLQQPLMPEAREALLALQHERKSPGEKDAVH